MNRLKSFAIRVFYFFKSLRISSGNPAAIIPPGWQECLSCQERKDHERQFTLNSLGAYDLTMPTQDLLNVVAGVHEKATESLRNRILNLQAQNTDLINRVNLLERTFIYSRNT